MYNVQIIYLQNRVPLMTNHAVALHNIFTQGRMNGLKIEGGGGRVSRDATMVGVERENFENLEPLDRRKRPFESVNQSLNTQNRV